MIRCLLLALVLLVTQRVTLLQGRVYNDYLIWSYKPENYCYGYFSSNFCNKKGNLQKWTEEYYVNRFGNTRRWGIPVGAHNSLNINKDEVSYLSLLDCYNYEYYDWCLEGNYSFYCNKLCGSLLGLLWYRKRIINSIYICRYTRNYDFYWAQRFNKIFGNWANVVDEIVPSVEVGKQGNIGILYPLRLMNTFNYAEVGETKSTSKNQVFGLGKYFNTTARKSYDYSLKNRNGTLKIKNCYNGLEPKEINKKEAVQCSFFLKPLLFEVKVSNEVYKMQCVFQVPPLNYFYKGIDKNNHKLGRGDLYFDDKQINELVEVIRNDVCGYRVKKPSWWYFLSVRSLVKYFF